MSLSDREVRLAHRVASALLTYPDEALVELLPAMADAVGVLPGPVARPLSDMLDRVAATPVLDLAAHYVETFDQRRRCSLYLTYHTHGDTRLRGRALLRFKEAFREAGMAVTDEELPDHLAVVLEFSARGHPRSAVRLINEHRPGLELLAAALHKAGSPYAGVVDAVRASLPEPTPAELAAVSRLALDGPPVEMVGRSL